MEANRKMSRGDLGRYRSVRNGIQLMFRFPSRMFEVVEQNTGVLQLLIEVEKKKLQSPSAVTALAHTILSRTKAYKVLTSVTSSIRSL